MVPAEKVGLTPRRAGISDRLGALAFPLVPKWGVRLSHGIPSWVPTGSRMTDQVLIG